ncbi:helix-turn-helix domain-containing protein [Roseibium sp.]|uniref:helix-turn-helix domain-containing protein n=1 Tax=Roseibium sp. TaxID=1936156 RepID=UPI003A96B6CE
MVQCREGALQQVSLVDAYAAEGWPDVNRLEAHLHLAEGYVARFFGIKPADIYGPTRGRSHIVEARHLVMYLARVEIGMTLEAVGRRYNRNRSTVSYACRCVEDRRDDPVYDLMVCEIEQLITLRDDYFFGIFKGQIL